MLEKHLIHVIQKILNKLCANFIASCVVTDVGHHANTPMIPFTYICVSVEVPSLLLWLVIIVVHLRTQLSLRQMD